MRDRRNPKPIWKADLSTRIKDLFASFPHSTILVFFGLLSVCCFSGHNGGRWGRQHREREGVPGEAHRLRFLILHRRCHRRSHLRLRYRNLWCDIGSRGVTSMDSFLKKFFPEVLAKEKADKSTNQYCKFDSQLLTSFTSSLYLAALIASFFASSVTRAFGRKWSMLGGGLTFLVGSALNGAAVNVLMLILGRILLGIGVGFANQVGLRRSRFLLNSR
ncbi:hypothetical protein GW17_00024982 [Ensete ventricosum]|nr:hypothetical protein GW17_00024982 [Ensete ventricosum]